MLALSKNVTSCFVYFFYIIFPERSTTVPTVGERTTRLSLGSFLHFEGKFWDSFRYNGESSSVVLQVHLL